MNASLWLAATLSCTQLGDRADPTTSRQQFFAHPAIPLDPDQPLLEALVRKADDAPMIWVG